MITAHADGVVLTVRAQPGARKTGIVGVQGAALKVAVTAPPDQGRANKALVETLADGLGLRRSQVELLSGLTARDKRFLLHGVTVQQIEQTIQAILTA